MERRAKRKEGKQEIHTQLANFEEERVGDRGRKQKDRKRGGMKP